MAFLSHCPTHSFLVFGRFVLDLQPTDGLFDSEIFEDKCHTWNHLQKHLAADSVKQLLRELSDYTDLLKKKRGHCAFITPLQDLLHSCWTPQTEADPAL